MKKYFLFTVGALGVTLLIGLGGILGRNVLWPISGLEFAKEVDDTFQRKLIYRIKKAEFPEWYDRHIGGVFRRLQNGASEADITDYTCKDLAAFHRMYAARALQSSPEKLVSVLNTHLAIIKELEKSSVAACAEEVMHGQVKSPKLLRTLKEPNVAQAILANAKNVLEAIVEGHKKHFEYGKPTADIGIYICACPLLAKSRHLMQCGIMSAFGGIADIVGVSDLCLLLTQSGY